MNKMELFVYRNPQGMTIEIVTSKKYGTIGKVSNKEQQRDLESVLQNMDQMLKTTVSLDRVLKQGCFILEKKEVMNL